MPACEMVGYQSILASATPTVAVAFYVQRAILNQGGIQCQSGAIPNRGKWKGHHTPLNTGHHNIPLHIHSRLTSPHSFKCFQQSPSAISFSCAPATSLGNLRVWGVAAVADQNATSQLVDVFDLTGDSHKLGTNKRLNKQSDVRCRKLNPTANDAPMLMFIPFDSVRYAFFP